MAGVVAAAGLVVGQEPAAETRPESPIPDILGRREGRGEGEIETDRDSFTPAVTTAGRSRLIVESAYTFLDNRGIPETHSFPELLFRWGVADRLELRLGWNYEMGGVAAAVSGVQGGDAGAVGDMTHEYTLNYGLKAAVTEQDWWLPAAAVIVAGRTPTGGDGRGTQLVLTPIVGWEFLDRWKFDAACRYGTGNEEGDHFDLVAPSAVVKAPVGEKISVHAEYFGLFSRDKAEDFVLHYFSPGAHYLITPDLEIGVRLGWGLNDQSARFFSNAGLGWRY
jgi:hypothetical protein